MTYVALYFGKEIQQNKEALERSFELPDGMLFQ